MTDQELLRAMEQMMDRKLEPINKRLDHMDERLDHMDARLDHMDERLSNIEEDLAEVRSGVNTLLDWADKVGDSISFPLPKIVP